MGEILLDLINLMIVHYEGLKKALKCFDLKVTKFTVMESALCYGITNIELRKFLEHLVMLSHCQRT